MRRVAGYMKNQMPAGYEWGGDMTGKTFDLSSAKPHYHNLSDKIPFAYAFGRVKAGTTYKYDMHYGLEFGIVLNGKMNIIFPDFYEILRL